MTDLVDAKEILELLDYAASKGQADANALLKRIKDALVRFRPDVNLSPHNGAKPPFRRARNE